MIADIISGDNFHEGLHRLPAMMITAGMQAAAAANMLRALMDASTAPRDKRWHDRYNEIDRDVQSAEDKYAVEEQPAPASIPYAPYDFPAEQTIARDEWLLGRHLLRGQVSGTAAMGGTGKSDLAIIEALAMTAGKQLLHDTVREVAPLRVVLINLEDDRNRMAKRIAAAIRYYKLTKEDIGDRLIVLAKGEIKIKVAGLSKRGKFARNEKTIQALTDLMTSTQSDVLSIDSFIRTHGVNENDNSAMQEVVECFEDIAGAAHCAVHLWHHSRKMGGEQATVEAARGAIAFIDACRSVRILETMARAEWEKLKQVVPGMKDAGYHFRGFNGKRNFAPPSDRSDWFVHESIILNNSDPDFFDDEGDNVGVVTPWFYPHVKMPAVSEADIAAALAKIKAGGPWRLDPRSRKEQWVGIPIAQVLCIDLLDPRLKAGVVKLVSDWPGAGRLTRVTRSDAHREPREYIEVAADK
ncbi:MAG: AAA family ATPase [Xanthobacteraceae bacterium]